MLLLDPSDDELQARILLYGLWCCRLVPKQLDARWLASRHLRPEVSTLFKPEEWQQGAVQPQVLVLPSWPTPEQVVQQLLWP